MSFFSEKNAFFSKPAPKRALPQKSPFWAKSARHGPKKASKLLANAYKWSPILAKISYNSNEFANLGQSNGLTKTAFSAQKQIP